VQRFKQLSLAGEPMRRGHINMPVGCARSRFMPSSENVSDVSDQELARSYVLEARVPNTHGYSAWQTILLTTCVRCVPARVLAKGPDSWTLDRAGHAELRSLLHAFNPSRAGARLGQLIN
jgi:hypothetical protein